MSEPFNRVTRTPHGDMIYNVNDVWIGRSLQHYGEFSQGEFNLFQEVVPEGGVVVEAGANIGAHTLGFARLVGESGKVYAYEPQRVVFQALCGNIALNSLTHVWAYQVALGDKQELVYLSQVDYHEKNNPGGVTIDGSPHGVGVMSLPLNDLSLERVDLIKADVEGYESKVLKGAEETIARCRPFLYVENDRGDPQILIDQIKALGYDLWWHKPPLFNPDNFNRNPVNVFMFPVEGGMGQYVSSNMFCAPTEKTFQGVVNGWEDADDYERIP
jgi:FkbM family methyltransferase